MFFVTVAASAQQTAGNISIEPSAQPSGELNMAPTNRSSELNVYQERQQVQNVVQQLDDAAVRNDAQLFDRALAPDYVASNADSKEEHRADIVNAHQRGDIKYDSVQIRDQAIDIVGETAVEHEIADIRGAYKGRRFDGMYRTSRMWKRMPNGNWQLAAMTVRRAQEPELSR
jgi:ketosteroid isomerase-like protein